MRSLGHRRSLSELCRPLLLLFFAAALGHGQTAAPPPSGTAAATPFTFHIYEDLVQLPTLALNNQQQSYPGLTPDKFNIQLDSGPIFHPPKARLEGDDPITLTLLLDAGPSSTRKLLDTLDQSVSPLLEHALTARDRILVYAVDCSLIGTGLKGAFSAEHLHLAIHAALTTPGLHDRGSAQDQCGSSRRLWDALAMVNSQTSAAPGWHVLFVVTDGLDAQSRQTWRDLTLYASRYSIAIFGLRPDPTEGALAGTEPLWLRQRHSHERTLDLLCAGTGGTVLRASPDDIWQQLTYALDLVRSRYILEFTRPRNGSNGLHEVRVTLADRNVVVLSTGMSFPGRDPRLSQDPNTLPTDLSNAPVVGTRRVITQPH